MRIMALQGNPRRCSFYNGMAICTTESERIYARSACVRLRPLGVSGCKFDIPLLGLDCCIDLVDSNCCGNETFLQRKYNLNDA